MIKIAVIGIWKIDSSLNRVIKYTTDIEKTLNSDYGKEAYKELHNVIEYDKADFKTENQEFVSGINCSVESAIEEMIITKKQYDKTDGILGFHAFQSFKENEVTPSLAHEIGVKLAEEMWGDRFEVVVSTHSNTNHIHNHFVINSVSFKDGKRYYDKRDTYAELRHLSDSLCEEYNLSILKEKTCRHSKINYANYGKSYVEKSNYYTIAKEDLDRAIEQAYSYLDFERLMKAMDYELYYRANKLSIRRSPYKKNIRVERSLGEEYSIDKIKERILTTEAVRIPFIEVYSNKNKTNNKVNTKLKKRYSGIRGLYLHYCYLLKVFPKKYPYKQLPPSIRIDVKKMEQISQETRLLVSKELNTYEQFFSYKKEVEYKLEDLLNKRTNLWYQYRKSKAKEDKEKIRVDIAKLNKKINPLQKEEQLLKGIEERTPKLEKNIEEFTKEENERKESEINEFIK